MTLNPKALALVLLVASTPVVLTGCGKNKERAEQAATRAEDAANRAEAAANRVDAAAARTEAAAERAERLFERSMQK